MAITLAERHLWAARAELALVEGRPDLTIEIVDARLASEHAANPDSVLGVPRLSLLRADALTTLARYDEAEQTLEMARDEAEVVSHCSQRDAHRHRPGLGTIRQIRSIAVIRFHSGHWCILPWRDGRSKLRKSPYST